ncbi:MAG: alpha/beta hydrolase [Saprospiraceae bacterium]
MFLAFFHFSAFAEKAVPQYFIELKEDKVVVGKYLNGSLKKIPIQKYSLDKVDSKQIFDFLFQNKPTSTLFYFHSFWGSFPPYHHDSLKKLGSLKGIEKIISIEWHGASLSYKKSWHKAPEQGKSVSELLNFLFLKNNNFNYLLCHSMGHRIFQGAFSSFREEKIHFEKIFFPGADLNSDVFETALKELPQKADSIYIYTHQKDFLLKMSKIVHGRNRLGLHGASKPPGGNVKSIEVTAMENHKKGISTHHVYFKRDPVVLEDIFRKISASKSSS